MKSKPNKRITQDDVLRVLYAIRCMDDRGMKMISSLIVNEVNNSIIQKREYIQLITTENRCV